MKSDSFLLKKAIILDVSFLLFLSNSSLSLFADIKAISTPEKKAENNNEIIAVVKSIM
jgi:hypothetical protein